MRREKISERMKFLQDLVPGCSKVVHGICVLFFSDHIDCFAKWIFHAAHLNRGLCLQVTGKAVMLDEIINYVQSLQRQVEVRCQRYFTQCLILV